MIISNSLIRNNTAQGSVGGSTGGGIRMIGGKLTITNSAILNNTADNGAGIYTFGGSISIINSTISGNVANGYGGGVDFDSGAPDYNANTLTILNSTIAYNTAGSTGGGIYQFQLYTRPVNVENSIIAQNSAPQGVDCSTRIANSYHNIYGVIIPSQCVVTLSYADIVTNPKIDSNLNGLISYHALLSGSPAINAGNDSNCPATDQRGVIRPQGDHCDIGAYEEQVPVHYVKWNAGGVNSGTSWTDAYTDLQSALSAASSGDEIWVAAGTYKPTTGTDRAISFELKNGVAIYGGFAGTETLHTQRDPATNVTILSGDIGVADDNSDNSYHVIVGSNTDNSAVLDGFTVTGGNADGSSINPQGRGGGMLNVGGDPTLSNIIFSDNSATFGGGMFNEGIDLGNGNWNGGDPILTNISFTNNSATEGGGMENMNHSSPTLMNVIFSGNTVTRSGGGMLNFKSCNPTLTNVTFKENSAAAGGGMLNWMNNDPVLTNVTFVNNEAIWIMGGGIGGGIGNYQSSPVLTSVTFSGNSAANSGGWIIQ